jgi:hypothetical protein
VARRPPALLRRRHRRADPARRGHDVDLGLSTGSCRATSAA